MIGQAIQQLSNSSNPQQRLLLEQLVRGGGDPETVMRQYQQLAAMQQQQQRAAGGSSGGADPAGLSKTDGEKLMAAMQQQRLQQAQSAQQAQQRLQFSGGGAQAQGQGQAQGGSTKVRIWAGHIALPNKSEYIDKKTKHASYIQRAYPCTRRHSATTYPTCRPTHYRPTSPLPKWCRLISSAFRNSFGKCQSP